MATTFETDPNSPLTTAANGAGEHLGDQQRLFSQLNQATFWREGAPKKVASHDGWPTWSQHLLKRRQPVQLERLRQTSNSPLSWGFEVKNFSPDLRRYLKLLTDPTSVSKNKSKEFVKKSLTSWTLDFSNFPQTPESALECLAIVHLLPNLTEVLGQELWWKVLDKLVAIQEEAASWQTDIEFSPEQNYVHQLLGGELPLSLAFLFPEIRALYKLRTNAWESQQEAITELLNGEGLPKASYLPFLRPLLATWLRSYLISKDFKKGGWKTSVENQFTWLITKGLLLSSPVGTLLLEDPPSETEQPLAWDPEFLATMLQTGGDTSDRTAAQELFPKKLMHQMKKSSSKQLPDTSDHCEWAELVVMRSYWDRKSPHLAIDYSNSKMRMEVWAGTQRLFLGDWETATKIDGHAVESVSPWEESCWFSDEDVDYVELTQELSNGATLDRQILLARDESFLMLADYVSSHARNTVQHSMALPLERKVCFLPEEETREGILAEGKPLARVLPLDLPEWRSDPRVGELSEVNGKLHLTSERPVHNLACPLLIDLDKSRLRKQCTWRQLTIAQSLEIQPHDVAVGYRAQCGKDQWLIYRSLDEPANRSILGQNLSVECLVGRFLSPGGEVDELLQVDD